MLYLSSKQIKQPPDKGQKGKVLIMKVTKKDAMEYAKKWVSEKERIVDTSWSKEDEILRVITITKETHLVYKLVIAYDVISEEYYKLSGGYMFTM